MLCTGNDDRAVRPLSSAAFRRRGRSAGFRRLAAALPLMAVLVFTFNGSAPAETSHGETAEAIQEGRWSQSNAHSLIEAIAMSAEEGLEPDDYDLAALRAAVEKGVEGAEFDRLADRVALRLARDYAVGRVSDREALDWHIPNAIDEVRLAKELDDALKRGEVRSWLAGLLPKSEQYGALKIAYARAPDQASRDLIRANLERWRWLPRELGDRYLYVNVPSYRLAVVEGGIETASYSVVVGAPKTPTPQLALRAQSIVVNPSWILPPSVLMEGGWQGRGYEVRRRADGSLMVRQPPGPRNALGRIKIDMPNAHAIYLHDTPHKSAFSRHDRALSHGCIRVQDIEDLATSLSDSMAIEDALSDPTKTLTLQLQRSVPVYLVYFTAEAGADGSVRFLGDPYDRDGALLRQLGGRGAGSMLMAAR